MAIFHMSFNNISNGKGRGAIASASYRSGERLWNEVEKRENKVNSRYAKEFNVALPIERESPEKLFEIKIDKWDWNNKRQYEVKQQQVRKQMDIKDVEKNLDKFVQSNHLEKSKFSEKENKKINGRNLKEFIEKNRLKVSNKHSEQKLSM